MTQGRNDEATAEQATVYIKEFPVSGYVRLNQILGPYGPLPISKSSFWAGVKSGRYPQPRKISARVTVWRAEDIRSLIATIEKTSK